jgi:predicted nucleic acid-binding protein
VTDFLVDTDIFIDHLRGARALDLGDQDSGAYSVITLAELFAGSQVDEAVVRELLAPFLGLDLTIAIAERAGRIRRQTGTRLPDAIIAATALEHGLTLMTRNRRDFANVPGLPLSP